MVAWQAALAWWYGMVKGMAASGFRIPHPWVPAHSKHAAATTRGDGTTITPTGLGLGKAGSWTGRVIIQVKEGKLSTSLFPVLARRVAGY
jgi:hypothetical protein